MARRAGLVVLVAALVGCGAKKAPPPPAPPPPPKPFRIVFPEGFTRLEMAARVKTVAKIAVRERHKPVRLNETGYLASSKNATVRCFDRTRRKNLEGFHPSAMQALLKHAWPGNVRELDHAVERAVLMALGATLESRDLGLQSGRELSRRS